MGLVTADQVKEFLQDEGEDQDTIITALIPRVSKAIANYTHREFEATEKAEPRVFAHPGGKLLDLVPYDLQSVTSVKTGTEGESPETLEETSYRLRPLPARDGVYQRLLLASNPGECEITVEGKWGFPEVPEDVQHFAITTIALWLRREVQAFERTFSLDEDRLERPEALPSAVRGGLATYRRPTLP